MVRWPRPPAPRRGINLVGLIVLVLAMVGIGVGMMRLAQQAGRSGHWFHDGQLAHDLADAGLKQTLYQLTRTNSLAAVPSAPPELQSALRAVFQAVTGGQSAGSIDLMTKATGYPPAIASLIKRIKDHAPLVEVDLEVKLTMAPATPLWPGLLEGVPALQGERKGSIRLQSKAMVKFPLGIPMTRRVILEKGYKVINLVPPVLGRFSLFVQDSPPVDPNQVPMKFTQPGTGASDGNAKVDSSAYPLVLESPVKGVLVAPGATVLDRAAFVTSISDTKFLDKQGWVYLGGTAAAPWKLNLAHGYGEYGESPLLPGFRPTTPTPFVPDPTGFNDRIAAEVTSQLAIANSACSANLGGPGDGLYTVLHGFANNYELISLPTGGERVVQQGGTRADLMKFDDVTPDGTSCFRLFGEPGACSPTLVFGPAKRLVMQRAMVWALIAGIGCTKAGRRRFHCFRWQKHGPREERIIAAGFQSEANYKLFGTTVRDDRPFAESLQVVLSAQGNGTYGSMGLLTQSGTGGTDKTFSSDLLPVLQNFQPATGLPPAALTALVNGTLDSPDLYKGNLSAAFKAFNAVMEKKLTYYVKPEAFTPAILDSGKLTVRGAILVDQPGPLAIPAIIEIKEGGILMTQGPISINGDIVHGTVTPPAQPEPLTLVSLKGDITIGAGVRNIEAMLVALDGQVKFAGDVTITGGIATKVLDPKTIVQGGKKRIKYSADIDPNGPNRTVFKVFYGGEDRVACVGEEEKP